MAGVGGVVSGFASAASGVSSLITNTISAGGSILNFGFDHPILSGIVGIVGFEAIKGAMNAKEGESAGVAAANNVGDLLDTVKDLTVGLFKGTGDAAKEVMDATTSVMTNGDVEDITEISEPTETEAVDVQTSVPEVEM